MMYNEAKFDDLKEGDEVYWYSEYDECKAQVERLTPKFVIIDGIKFRKNNGCSYGISISSRIQPINEYTTGNYIQVKNAKRQEYLCNEIIKFARSHKAVNNCLEVLEKINKMIEESYGA